ncbi:MAG: cytochrome d ubiquinol oxidase subunit II [Proteobacteria bacterium]|nr:cytochrome d ubiquinol oxidase subunit II [Pseudomonadota bacterium]
MLEFFDYECLRIIWWAILGFLLIGFAVMDGFDLGVGILLPFVAKTDEERRVVLNTVGPVWEGNQVWFILGGGAIFAAWPHVYAVSFSGFYFAMLLVLLALILRPVGFDYRSKIQNKTWRQTWDYCLFVSGLVPSLVFGVAIGNVLQGVPFSFDEFMVINNQIGFFSLFSPFALLCGIVSVTMLTTHGATFLAIKTEGEILKRVQKFLTIFPPITIILFAIGGLLLGKIDGYKLLSFAGTLADSNPLAKEVTRVAGGWFDNYSKYQWMLLAPALGFLGQISVLLFTRFKHFGKAFIASAISIVGIISTVGLTLFPFILPSSLDPNSSLIIWDSSSSYRALFVMLIATIIFMPLILFYTSWVFRVLKGKVTEKDIKKDSKFLY